MAGLARLGYLHKPLWTKCAQMTGADSMHVLWEWSNMTWQNTVERPIVIFLHIMHITIWNTVHLWILWQVGFCLFFTPCFNVWGVLLHSCCFLGTNDNQISQWMKKEQNSKDIVRIVFFFLHWETMSKPLTPLTVGQSNLKNKQTNKKTLFCFYIVKNSTCLLSLYVCICGQFLLTLCDDCRRRKHANFLRGKFFFC